MQLCTHIFYINMSRNADMSTHIFLNMYSNAKGMYQLQINRNSIGKDKNCQMYYNKDIPE